MGIRSEECGPGQSGSAMSRWRTFAIERGQVMHHLAPTTCQQTVNLRRRLAIIGNLIFEPFERDSGLMCRFVLWLSKLFLGLIICLPFATGHTYAILKWVSS